jgi:hypothetical protein
MWGHFFFATLFHMHVVSTLGHIKVMSDKTGNDN